jgi:glutathione-specific gamma-glutamylcyclotransferase
VIVVPQVTDPFLHHPELRDRIGDPETSFFRSFQPSDFDDRMAALGRPADWRYTDNDREARRRAALADRLHADVWVFAYGSLMWDPAFRFAEVRVGRVQGYARRFCLKDTWGGRGTAEAPGLMAGLMAALDHGPGCTGLAFRISQTEVEAETKILWRREQISGAYAPQFMPVATAQGEVEALAFVANHASPVICSDLTQDETVRYLATGTGILGTSRAYLESIAAQFAALGIADPDVQALVEAVRRYPAAEGWTAAASPA